MADVDEADVLEEDVLTERLRGVRNKAEQLQSCIETLESDYMTPYVAVARLAWSPCSPPAPCTGPLFLIASQWPLPRCSACSMTLAPSCSTMLRDPRLGRACKLLPVRRWLPV